MAILRSKRLQLRRFKHTDLRNLTELEQDPDIMKFTPSRVPLSMESIAQRLSSLLEKEKSRAPFGVWAAELTDTNDFAGWLMLMPTQPEFPELGFMIVKRHWGKGIATEAGARLIEFGFKNLKVKGILANVDQENAASKSVLKKLGFQFSKTISVPDKILQRNIALEEYVIFQSLI